MGKFYRTGCRCCLANCGWHDSVRAQIQYGETAVIHGKEQARAEQQTNMFFMAVHKRMQRTGRTQLLMYDIALEAWVQLEAAEAR